MQGSLKLVAPVLSIGSRDRGVKKRIERWPGYHLAGAAQFARPARCCVESIMQAALGAPRTVGNLFD